MVTALDHINITTDDGEEMRDFFTRVIGLREGARPRFSFPGYWLYAGDTAVVHISVSAHAAPAGRSGAVDHVAMRCEGYREMTGRLAQHGIPLRESQRSPDADRQVFVEGPRGVTLELIFTLADVAAQRTSV